MNKLWVVLALAVPLAAANAQGKAGAKEAKDANGAKASPAPAQGVSWSGQVVKATGQGAPDVKATSPAQARIGAERAALADALRNLVAQVKGIQVSAGKTMADAMVKDEIRTKVEGLVRGYKVVGKRYYSDGGVEVDVEAPLSLLTDVIDPDATPATQLAAATPAPAAPAAPKGTPPTGLVIDAREVKVTPALSPRVLDAGGKALYSVDWLSADARKSTGVAAYVQTLDEAKKSMKAGENPLVVKASKAEGTDLVLALDDAKKLTDANPAFLTEGKVVVVMN